jgi:HNH endonuclease
MILSSHNCLFCNEPITSGDRRKKFCNLSCAASYNNSKAPKRKADSVAICGECQSPISLKKKPKGGFYQREYCDACLKLKKIYQITGASLEDFLENQTKASLYKRRKNWQSANSSLRNNSRKVYLDSNKPQKCFFCGWDKCIEVAHLDPVKDFPDDAKITEINSPSNLIGTCPNHHWEYDHGDLNKVKATLGREHHYVSIGLMITERPIDHWSGDGWVFVRRTTQGSFKCHDGRSFPATKYITLLIDNSSGKFPLAASESEHFSFQSPDGQIDKTKYGSVVKIVGPWVIVGLE